MLATIVGAIVKAVGDSLLSALFNFIQQEMDRRGLIQQGREQQHTDDLQSTVTEAKDAAKIEENVSRSSDAELDAGLERVRNTNTTPSTG